MKYSKHFKYQFIHKWLIFKRLFKSGLYLSAITHDLSKFFPDEWTPNELFGTENVERTNIHHHRNKHHWQYWVFIRKDGRIKAIEMKYPYNLEMVCDWLAVSTYQKSNLREWYNKHKKELILHPKTRRYIESKI